MCTSQVTAQSREQVGALRGPDREWLAAKLRRGVAWSVWPVGMGLGAAKRAISYRTIMTLRWTRLGYLAASQPAPVAQLDRASASGAEGPAFESRLAHRITQAVRLMREMWPQQAVEPRARHGCQHRHHEDRRSAAD